ncbi:F-box/kelch-repeat protein [Raphanus sativus]|uniref:F-box/kelch-repeat protein At4g39590-like n=1 Tax=Raphanus sativus TaxID=3726 RepID=A0A6J0M8Y4_RAPSA|nr:F-box/kelch-repeat protein At4g39590-like [Raphanus sativus]KAJ4914058.1 F-box/kelch-repeat protein [Raphanus sativus]
MSSTARSSPALNGDQPPRKKMAIQCPEISIFCLPLDLILNIISRISKMYYPTLSLVSKKIRSVVDSPELYKTRSRLHRTESCLYVCLRYHLDDSLDPNPYWFALCRKPNRTITDQSSGLLLIPITSPDVRHEPSSSVVAVGSNIYKMGGHTPSSSEVSVLDCRFNTWHSAPVMREKRSSPAASLVDGKIYVAGGCEDLNSVNCVEVFDPKTQTWGSVSNPGVKTQLHRAELKSFGLGGKLYLLGGDEDTVYDPKEASWNPIGLGMHMAMGMAMGMEMYEAMDMEMDMNGVASAVSYYHGVIGDVLFLWNEREFRWYDSKASSWKKLYGVEDHLPDFDGDFKMVDVDGKMVVLWKVFGRRDKHMGERSIWCAEIALERRDGDEMWGNVEWFDVVLTTHEPCCLLDADVLSATV